MGFETDFLLADKQKHFPQIDSITLDVHSQIYPKYPKHIFAISQEKFKGRR